MKKNIMLALAFLVLFVVLFQPQINDSITGMSHKADTGEKLIQGDYDENGYFNYDDYEQFYQDLRNRINVVYETQVDFNKNGLMDWEDVEILKKMVEKKDCDCESSPEGRYMEGRIPCKTNVLDKGLDQCGPTEGVRKCNSNGYLEKEVPCPEGTKCYFNARTGARCTKEVYI